MSEQYDILHKSGWELGYSVGQKNKKQKVP